MREYEIGVLERLAHAGVGFVISVSPFGDGGISLPIEEVVTYMADPMAFKARHWGVSVALYLKWREFTYNPHCIVKTTRGRYCKHHVEVPLRPTEFIPGVTDVCNYHRERI